MTQQEGDGLSQTRPRVCASPSRVELHLPTPLPGKPVSAPESTLSGMTADSTGTCVITWRDSSGRSGREGDEWLL